MAWLIPSYRSAPEYLAAEDFNDQIEPGDGIDYEWVLAYAKDLSARREKIAGIMDEKADAIIKYMGGGVGLFALGAIAAVPQGQGYLLLYSLPAVLFALCSVFLAALIRKPNDMPGLPSVADAMNYANRYTEGDAAKIKFLGQAHMACEAWRVVCRAKGKVLVWATGCYFTALLALLIPAVVACIEKWSPPAPAGPTAHLPEIQRNQPPVRIDGPAPAR